MAAIDFPASPANGATFAPANGVTYRYVTPPGIWTVANGPVDTVIASDLPPANPAPNQLWFNASLAMLYVYYDDGNTSQWVPSMPVPSPNSFPIGFINDFAGAAAPSGWLLCDGASVTVVAYPALHAVIGYVYGGSGANFNVPDLGGRVTAGKEAVATRLTVAGAGINGSVVGAAGGTQTHTLTIAQLASHTHPIAYQADGSFIYQSWGGGTVGTYAGSNMNTAVQTATTTGGDQPHQNTQPTMIMNKIIRAL